jgi:VIT1/CCC1 family predicted Fe2+/Mn2+ transporter
MENQSNLTAATQLCTYPMCLIDYFLFSVGPITAVVAAFFGLKSWLRYEIVVSVALAFILFIQPQWIIAYLVKKIHFSIFFSFKIKLIKYILSQS